MELIFFLSCLDLFSPSFFVPLSTWTRVLYHIHTLSLSIYTGDGCVHTQIPPPKTGAGQQLASKGHKPHTIVSSHNKPTEKTQSQKMEGKKKKTGGKKRKRENPFVFFKDTYFWSSSCKWDDSTHMTLRVLFTAFVACGSFAGYAPPAPPSFCLASPGQLCVARQHL